MQRQRSPVPAPHPSRGMTLLEVVLASALALILVGAVYSALNQAWRLNYSGRIELERNQIARSIIRQMELDIRAVMFDASPSSTDSSDDSSSSSGSTGSTGSTSNTSGSTSSTSSSSTTSSSTSTTSTTEDEWTGSLGIRGTATELWIDLSHVSRDLEFQANSSVVRASDLQTVAYFLSNSSLAGDSAADPYTGAVSPITLQDQDGVGLCRSQGERSILRALNSGDTSDTTLPGPVKLLAPEIESISFQYFDGLSWYTEWDSSSSGALPRAVEVIIMFEPPPKLTGFLLSPAVSSGTDSYRMVIPVPVSDPMPPEDSF
jgi:prepilin-type N-terminal cleavage/methylation domain-containing protein